MNLSRLLVALALLLLGTVPSQAWFGRIGGGSPGGGGGGTEVLSLTFLNSGGGTVPGGVTMLQGGAPFAPGAVSSSQIPQPSIGGTNLAQWQCDNRVFWSDGSLRFCVFSGVAPSALAAAGTTQVVFKTATGSFPTALPGGAGVASITANSDFKVALTGVNTAWVNNQAAAALPEVTSIGLQVASNGTVSSGNIRLLPVLGQTCAGYSCGNTFTVQGCSGGTAPTLTIGQTANIPSSVTITNAGSVSGCPYIGSGNFTFDANAILNGIASIPQCSSQTNAQACIYAQGDTKLGIRIFGYYVDTAGTAWAASTAYVSGNQRVANGNLYQETATTCLSASSGSGPVGLIGTIADGTCTWTAPADTSSATAPVAATAYIEAWFNSSGGFYAAKAMIGSGTPVYRPGSTIINVSANTADFKSGSTEIRGSADGSGTAYAFNGITTNSNGGMWWTADVNSNPYWWQTSGGAANSAAFSAVVPALTASDEVYWDASRAELPLDRALVPTTKTITIGPPGSSENPGSGNTCTYLPYSYCAVDSVVAGITAGSSHSWDALYTIFSSEHNLAQTIGPGSGGDYGVSLLTGVRSVALGWMGAIDGFYEADTWHQPNIIPNTQTGWTPPAAYIDPVRPSATASVYINNFYGDMVSGAQGAYVVPDDAHYPSVQSLLYAYLTQGERWVLDGLDGGATNAMFAYASPVYSRGAVLGSATFPATNNSPEYRANVWFRYAQLAPATFLPAGEPDDTYQREVVKENYALMDAALHTPSTSFQVGTYSGAPQQGTTGAYDLRPMGVPLSLSAQVPVGGIGNGVSGFMSQYGTGVDVSADNWLGGDIPIIATVVNNEMNNFEVPNSGNCPYVIMSYTLPTFINELNRQPLTSWDATDLTTTARPVPQYGDAGFQTYAGDSEVDIAANPGSTAARAGGDSAVAGTVTDTTHFALSSGWLTSYYLGAVLYDHTTPANIPPHTWVTAYSGGVVTTNHATSVIAGDTIWISPPNTYPYQSDWSGGIGPVTIQPGMPDGTYVWLMNFDTPYEQWPYLGTDAWTPPTPSSYFPPSTSAGTLVQGTPVVFHPDNAYSTEGHLTTLGGTTIVFSSTGNWSYGFNYNAACPTRNFSTGIYSMNFNGGPPSDALTMDVASIKAWQALGHSSTALTNAIAALTAWTGFPAQSVSNPYWALAGAL